MHLSERERITILMLRGYGNNVRSYEAVAILFNNTFPNRSPITKFSELSNDLNRFSLKTGLKQEDQKLQTMMTRTSKFYNYL